MHPILFRIGHFSISTYGVLVALAFLAAAWVSRRALAERGIQSEVTWSLLTWALVGGFVGAKLYYVVLHGDAGALFSRAGLVWYGGLLGGAAAVLWAIHRKALPLASTADALAPALPLGHAIGHVGCFFSGDSYGIPSDLPWAVAFPYGAPPSTAGALRTEFGVSLPASVPDDLLVRVHPTMLYSSLALLLVFFVLWSLRRKSLPPGWLFGLYLILSGAERFLVEFLRAKDDRLLWGFTTAQGIAALAVLAGLAIMVWVWQRRPDAQRLTGSHLPAPPPRPEPRHPGRHRPARADREAGLRSRS